MWFYHWSSTSTSQSLCAFLMRQTILINIAAEIYRSHRSWLLPWTWKLSKQLYGLNLIFFQLVLYFRFSCMDILTWSCLSLWYSFYSIYFVSFWSFNFFSENVFYFSKVYTCTFILYFIKSCVDILIHSDMAYSWMFKTCLHNIHLLVLYYLLFYILYTSGYALVLPFFI